jgi:hypothetical protein
LPDLFWLPKESGSVFSGALLFCLLVIGVHTAAPEHPLASVGYWKEALI